MAVVFISTDVLISGEVLTVPQNQWLLRQLPSSRFHHRWKWQVRSYTLLFLIFTDTSEAMVVLHTHFALLYLRGGLCWDCGLACRRSTAIFTSENKSIQTLNITVTCNSVYAFTQNGVAASTIPRSKWNLSTIIRTWTSKLDEMKYKKKKKLQQIEMSDLSILVYGEQEIKEFFSPSKLAKH